MVLEAAKVGRTVWFALVLGVWGFALAAICVPTYFGLKYAPLNVGGSIDTTKNETLVWVNEVCRRERSNVFSKYFCHNFESGFFVVFFWIHYVLMCISWIVYCNFGWKKATGLLLLQFFGVVLAIGGVHLTENENLWKFGTIAKTLPGLSQVVAIYILLPKTSWICIEALKMWLVFLVVSAMGLFGSILRESLGPVAFILVMTHVGKIAITMIVRGVSRRLLMNLTVSGPDVSPRREFAWYFLLALQIYFSVYTRLLVTKLKTLETYIWFTALNGFFEVALRISVRHQDQLFTKFLKKFKPKNLKRKTSVIMPVTRARVTMLNGKAKVGTSTNNTLNTNVYVEVRREWYAFVVVGDMISEYIGLFANLGLMLMFHDSISTLPLPAYAVQDNPFEDQMPVYDWLQFFAIQMFGELIVDVICLLYEEHVHEIPMRMLWESQQNRNKLLNLIPATMTGIALGAISVFTISGGKYGTQFCVSQDICSCAPPKHDENLYFRYCMRLYPNTTGMPPFMTPGPPPPGGN